ncbi:MAG: peptide ligase PGM1-related protein [Myxococcota bacterium]
MSLALPSPTLPLSAAEVQARFDALQARLVPLWRAIESLEDDGAQTIVVVPSLTVEYAALRGSVLQAYEERFLFLLLLLRQPTAHLVYVTSQLIQPAVVDYYLGLLPGVVPSHARRRLHLLSPQDGAPQPLSIKLLQRPQLLERIRAHIADPQRAHLVPFNTTEHERDLALHLGIPMYGADPRLLALGTKSGCRKLFREVGMPLPAGYEDLRGEDDVVRALQELKREVVAVDHAMVKHDDGVSGEGNAVVDLTGVDPHRREDVRERLHAMRTQAEDMTATDFLDKLAEQGGVVEERVRGDAIVSPSVQLRVTPLGQVELLSTHDQLLGGAHGQTFEGCVFPAATAYAARIAAEARKADERLVREGVLGRYAIDFVCAQTDAGWSPYAIELNLRKGGTTHPYLTLQFLTDGRYDPEAARFLTATGQPRHYVATDALKNPAYRSLTPEDLFDLSVRYRLHFDPTRQAGVVFHMMSAIGDHGRLGFTAVAPTRADARTLYDRTVAVLDREAAANLEPRPLPD